MQTAIPGAKIITEPEEARFLLGDSFVSEIEGTDISSDASAQSAREKLTERYALCKGELESAVKGQLGERRTKFEADAAQLKAECDAQIDAINKKYAAMSVEERTNKRVRKEYKDEVKGAKTVYLRSLNKVKIDYDTDVTDIKLQRSLLLQERNRLSAKLKGKEKSGLSLGTSYLQFKARLNIKKTLSSKQFWVNLAPLFVLVALFVAYVSACNITGYTLNIDTIITYGIYVAVVAVGAVFIYSQGAFDMSLGNACLVCAAVGIMSYSATGNIFLSFILCVFLGVVLGIVNAILANCLRLPVMVMTLTMQSVLSAVYSNITADSGGYIEVNAIRGVGGIAMKWIILIAFIVFCVFLFNYTKIGRRSKMLGSNATCAKFTGISVMKAGIISFAISGIGLGLCGFLYITQMGSVNASGTALTSVGLNVIIAINIGGMPTSGGRKSKISAGIIGGFFLVILDELFAAMGLDLYRYVAKGIIFLVAVCLTSFGDRTKRLA